MKTVAILGAGNMGTAMAQIFAGNAQRVHLWSIEPDVLEEIRDRRLNSKYLPGVELHQRIEAKWDLEEALTGAWLVVFTVPSQVVRALAKEAAPFLAPGQATLNVAKGLEQDTHLRMSQVLAQEMPRQPEIATMGGPAIAAELACGLPAAVVVAAPDISVATAIQAAMENDFLKVETTTDLCGVEMGATLKNAYAIALGMCDGLGLGANSKAFLASVALAEMATISRALEANERTLFGLAGVGDLLTTGYSAHSRNRTLGEKLGAGGDWREFLRTHTVEGVVACRSLKELADSHDVRVPLLNALHSVLFQEQPGAETLRRFLRGFSFRG